MVRLIKKGRLDDLQDFFETHVNEKILKQLNLYSGYDDSDFKREFKRTVRHVPVDATI